MGGTKRYKLICAMIDFRRKLFDINIVSASSACVISQSGRGEVNILSSSEYSWEGVLCNKVAKLATLVLDDSEIIIIDKLRNIIFPMSE